MTSWPEKFDVWHCCRWVVEQMPTKSLWSSCGCRNSMTRELRMAPTPTPTLTQKMGLSMTGTMRRRPGSQKYENFFTSHLQFSHIMFLGSLSFSSFSVYGPVFTAGNILSHIQYVMLYWNLCGLNLPTLQVFVALKSCCVMVWLT